jgi:hypothetical protein
LRSICRWEPGVLMETPRLHFIQKL